MSAKQEDRPLCLCGIETPHVLLYRQKQWQLLVSGVNKISTCDAVPDIALQLWAKGHYSWRWSCCRLTGHVDTLVQLCTALEIVCSSGDDFDYSTISLMSLWHDLHASPRFSSDCVEASAETGQCDPLRLNVDLVNAQIVPNTSDTPQMFM